MTDRTPDPAEEDVERLARLWYDDLDPRMPLEAVWLHRARCALEAGVQLPPEPEPEPQERYFVAESGMAWDWGVYDRQDTETITRAVAEAKDRELADNLARLLNLDAKYEGGVAKAHEGLIADQRELRSAYRAVDDQLTQARAEVERLTAELAEQKDRAEIAEMDLGDAQGALRALVKASADAASPTDAPDDRCVMCGSSTAHCRQRQDVLVSACCAGCTHGDDSLPPHRRPTPDDATGPTDTATSCPDGGKCHHDCVDRCWRVTNAAPLSGAFPGDEWPAGVAAAHRPTDTATEPLFTGRVTTRGQRQHADKPDVVVGIPGPKQDKLNLFARVGEKVDVYPHGVRPAAATVTADMVRDAMIDIGRQVPIDGTVELMADALNRLLAEQGGEG